MAELAVSVSRVVNAPIERVFRAWTDPEQMKQWYSPEGMTTPDAGSDNSKGGNYHVTMKAGDQEFTRSGVYLEFDEPNRLVFTWGDDGSIITVAFKRVDADKTEVALQHSGLGNEAEQAQYDEGWAGTVKKLGTYIGQ